MEMPGLSVWSLLSSSYTSSVSATSLGFIGGLSGGVQDCFYFILIEQLIFYMKNIKNIWL